MKYNISLIVLIAIFSLFFAFHASAEDAFLISSEQLNNLNSRHGVIFEQPNGPFAVMLFNESAQGTHLGIIYYQQMGNPVNGKWWISDRFWQEKPWSEDITGFLWDKDGKHLYIGTSEVYGDGSLFKLDLNNKEYMRLYPANAVGLKDVSSVEIIGFEKATGKLIIEVTSADYETTQQVGISTN